MLPYAAIMSTAVGALLWADRRDWRPGVWVAKPLAATIFVVAALDAGALATPYGRAVLAALALSWLGDVLLLPRRSPRVFQAGVTSFLLGHLAFVAAFAVRGLEAVAGWITLAVLALPLALALRWLRPHVPVNMRIAVGAYMAVITAMVACAVATVAHAGNPAIAVGAAMFYVSDLSVARDRFVAEAFANRLWGLPLYFAAQLVLASTVAPT